MPTLTPLVIPLSSVPVRPWHVPGASIARIMTNREHGSDFMVGVTWMDPGVESDWWSFEERDTGTDSKYQHGPHHEMYFGIRGQLQVRWTEGVLDFGPDDTVFLTPGWRYQLANPGTEPGYFVYCVSPAALSSARRWRW